MALPEQLGDDSWLVVCAACCHMSLVFAIMHFFKFVDFLKIFKNIFFNLVSINYTEWSTIPACPSLTCSFNRVILKGLA